MSLIYILHANKRLQEHIITNINIRLLNKTSTYYPFLQYLRFDLNDEWIII